MWPLPNPDDAFLDAVRQEVAPLARDCGASLKQIEPTIFGFCTDYAVLTIGAYPGHFRGICLTLRRRVDREVASVKDGADIGLRNIEEFVTGQYSEVYSRRQRWAAGEIKKEVAGLVRIVREVALPFLTTPNGNWLGLRAFVDEKIEKHARKGSL